ncbi:MAG: type 1 glutamine amidotransferase, partial [Candidatus Xenobia bacterium]
MIYLLRQWAHGQISGMTSHFERNGLSYRLIEAWDVERFPEIAKNDTVIALGGPSSACNLHQTPFLAREADFLSEVERVGACFLGICLGHQVRGRMAGHEVRKGQCVFGIEPVELTPAGRAHWLFHKLPRQPRFYQHHADYVVRIAPPATLLACSTTCPVEAVAWGDRSASVQFHPELLGREIPSALERYPERLQDAGMTAEAMLARVPAAYDEYTRRLFDNFFYSDGLNARPAG